MRRPTDSVRMVLFDRADRKYFLILCESDDQDNWKLPGGKFDDDQELPQAAATRELAEELGVKPKAVALRKVSELTNDDGVSKRYIFAGTVSRDAVKPSHEIAQTAWVTAETVPVGKNRSHIRSALEVAAKT